ncbi:unnamed protein product, partial [marine sediment metagenome]
MAKKIVEDWNNDLGIIISDILPAHEEQGILKAR